MGSRNSTVAPFRPIAPTRLAVGVAAVQGSDIPCHTVVVKALCPGQTIYVGTSSGVTTANGYPLADGEFLTFEVKNANQLWFISDAAAQAVAFFPGTFC
jgi:hypothetical protein